MKSTQVGIETQADTLADLDWDAINEAAAAVRAGRTRTGTIAGLRDMCPHGCGRIIQTAARASHFLIEHLSRETTAATRVYDLMSERDERAAGQD